MVIPSILYFKSSSKLIFVSIFFYINFQDEILCLEDTLKKRDKELKKVDSELRETRKQLNLVKESKEKV